MKKYPLMSLLALLCTVAIGSFMAQSDDAGGTGYLSEYYMPVIKNRPDFDHVLGRNTYVVAYVYTLAEYDKRLVSGGVLDLLKWQAAAVPAGHPKKEHTARYKEVNRIFDMVQRYEQERDEQFSDVGVKFIGVNLVKDDLQELGTTYNLQAGNDYLLFFKNGKLATKQKVTAGFSRDNFDSFIDKTKLQDYVAKALERMVRDTRKTRCYRRRYYSCDTGPYVGVGGYDPYWYGPGWRSHYYGPSYWGYSYPYRGYYYGAPRFGISFSV